MTDGTNARLARRRRWLGGRSSRASDRTRITFGTHLASNFLKNALRARVAKDATMDPLVLAYFVTFRCNLRCTYCEYATAGFAQQYLEATTDEAKRILQLCRQGVPSIAFTGGEPLMRRDIAELTRHARRLGFRPISLFTNSLLLPEREDVLEHVDFLQISLDTLDESKQDRLNGKPGIGRAVQDHVRRYAPWQRDKGFRINLNCVVGAENLGDVPALMDFAAETDTRFSIAPKLDDAGMPAAELLQPDLYDDYRNVLQQVIDRKSADNSVVDIEPFLVHLRDFKDMRCYPEMTPRVYPDGSFVHPCPNLWRGDLNVLSSSSWGELVGQAERSAGRAEACAKPCFLPCYLETALLVRHPFCLLRELGG